MDLLTPTPIIGSTLCLPNFRISEDADLGLAEKLQVAVADQIKSSGKVGG